MTIARTGKKQIVAVDRKRADAPHRAHHTQQRESPSVTAQRQKYSYELQTIRRGEQGDAGVQSDSQAQQISVMEIFQRVRQRNYHERARGGDEPGPRGAHALHVSRRSAR